MLKPALPLILTMALFSLSEPLGAAAIVTNAVADLDAVPPTLTLQGLGFGVVEGEVFIALDGTATLMTLVGPWSDTLLVVELPTSASGTYIVAVQPPGEAFAFFDVTFGPDITSVGNGAGLTGGGTAGDVVLDVDFAGAGVSNTVSRSDHAHPGEDITSGTVAEGFVDALITRDIELAAHAVSGDHDGRYVNLTGDTMTGTLTISKFLNGAHLLMTVENTGSFSAAGYRLKTPAAGNDWTIVAQETGGGASAGFQIQGGSVPVSPLVISSFSGNVGISTSTPSNILTVQQTSATDPIADAWTTYSSRRWKTNISTLEGALDKVEHLRGVSFDWKSSAEHDIGLIAEEVGVVVPEVVVWEEDSADALSVDYGRLTALLIEAIKEQQAQIRALRAELDILVEQPKHQTAEAVQLRATVDGR